MKNASPKSRKLTAILLSILFFFLFTATAFSQGMTDVVYLKNGSIVRGIIIEQVPYQSIKIKTRDGNIFVFQISDIEKMTKEGVQEEEENTEEIPDNAPARTKNVQLRSFGLLFEPLGFAQFGPILQGEFRIGPNSVLGPHLRMHGMGVLSHLAADYDELSTTTMAIGIHFKQFLGNPKFSDRFYIGGILEYGFGTGKSSEAAEVTHTYYDYYGSYTITTWEDAEYSISFLTLASNFGYRWRFNSGFFLGVGLLAGIAQELSDEMTSPYSKSYDLDMIFFGMAELSLGFEF